MLKSSSNRLTPFALSMSTGDLEGHMVFLEQLS